MKRRSSQKGFLAIVAVILIVIVAFITVTATQQFAGNSLASQGLLRSSQSLYIGLSGLEQTKSAIINGTSCSNYDSGVQTFTTSTGGSGQYQVTGSTNVATAILAAGITASATTIPVTVTSGTLTASQGVITIDNETIAYSSYSGGNLINAARGANGTTASTHSINAKVLQIECILTSKSAIPTLSILNGARIFTTLLYKTPAAFGYNVSGGSGNIVIPTITSTGTVAMDGAAIVKNLEVTDTSADFTGSNVLTSANSAAIYEGAETEVNDGTGAPDTQSTAGSGNILADVIKNTTLFSSGTLWSHYFKVTPAVAQSHAHVYSNASSLNGLTGQVIWFNGNLNLTNAIIGSPTSPVILIVNGNLNLYGTSGNGGGDDNDYEGHGGGGHWGSWSDHSWGHGSRGNGWSGWDGHGYNSGWGSGHNYGQNEEDQDHNDHYNSGHWDDRNGGNCNSHGGHNEGGGASSPTIYGFVYVIGTTTIQSNSRIYGQLVSQGTVNVEDASLVSLDSSIVALASLLTGDTTINYLKNAVTLQEQFQ